MKTLILPEDEGEMISDRLAQKFALDLVELGAIKFGQFQLSQYVESPNAAMSPYYINLRDLCSYPKAMKRLAVNFLAPMLVHYKCDLLVPVPDGANMLAGALSFYAGLPMIVPRKGKKKHGLEPIVDGLCCPGQRAVIVEDVVSSGGSVLALMPLMRVLGLRVSGVLSIFDREEGGRENLAREGLDLYSVYRITSFFDFCFEKKKISERQYHAIQNYLKTRKEKTA